MNYSAPRFLFRRHEILRHIQPSGSFIEIGAGNLALSREMLRFFERGLAVDFTDDLAESYAKLPPDAAAVLEISNADIMQDELPGQFDCAIACEVMEHIEEDTVFLEKLRAVLKPGGQAIVSVPARSKYWSIHDELVGHIRRYEKSELAGKAQRAGFEDVRIVAYGVPWVNMLRIPRVWLARRSISDRQDWDAETKTKMSNHRQIPRWLAGSALTLVLNRYTCYPFALVSRLFNHTDFSNGYLLIMRKVRETE